VLLQSPTTHHELARNAIDELQPGGGGTAIGEALQTALQAIRTVPEIHGKRPPGAIVLISDGTSNVGVGPGLVASQARRQHVPIYTIAIGTGAGTMAIKRGGHTVTTGVPVNPTELRQIAANSGGRSYTAADSDRVKEIYTHLAKKLGHTQGQQQLMTGLLVAGLVVLLLGSALSVRWFVRIA